MIEAAMKLKTLCLKFSSIQFKYQGTFVYIA